MKLPRCEFLCLRGKTLVSCSEPAEYWDCSDPVDGPVCFKHACKRCGGENGLKLTEEEIAEHVARQEKYH